MKASVFYKDEEHEVEYEEIGPSIYVYRNAIRHDWNVVDRIENTLAIPGTRFAWQPAGVGYGVTELESRRCFDFKIDEQSLGAKDEYSEDIYDVYYKLMDSLKISLEHYKPENYLAMVDHFECINIVRYGKGEFFNVHTDDGDPYRCTVSAVGYPNDNYEGGELWFPKFDLKYKPSAGDWVIFPSAYSYAHSSEPVTDDGVKYSFVIMMDRNSFAHRADSPIFHSEELREKHGVL